MHDYHFKIQLMAEIREVLRVKELCLELADAVQSTLRWQIDYCKKNNIPILNEQQLIDLLNRCEVLINQLYPNLPPDFEQPTKNTRRLNRTRTSNVISRRMMSPKF